MPVVTLTPNQVETVTLTARNVDEVEVVSDGAAEVFYRVGYGGGVPSPTVDDQSEGAFWLPAAACARSHIRKGARSETTVKLVSSGAARVAVQVLR